MPETPDQTTDRSRYPAHPRHVKTARRRAERVVAGWGAAPETVDVVCVLSEFVTNAGTHTRRPQGREVGVTLRLLRSFVRIEVCDAASTQTTLRNPGAAQKPDGRRGLVLVDQLCHGRWGSVEEVIGKTMWAEIPLTPTTERTPQEPSAVDILPALKGARSRLPGGGRKELGVSVSFNGPCRG